MADTDINRSRWMPVACGGPGEKLPHIPAAAAIVFPKTGARTMGGTLLSNLEPGTAGQQSRCLFWLNGVLI